MTAGYISLITRMSRHEDVVTKAGQRGLLLVFLHLEPLA